MANSVREFGFRPYAAQVMSSREAELERVLEKYPPMRGSDLCIFALATAALFVASLYSEVGWYFFFGILAAMLVWEFTKLRMRRNAREFARPTT